MFFSLIKLKSSVFVDNIWLIASKLVQIRTLESAYKNSEFLKFRFSQKIKEMNIGISKSLVPALVFNEIISEFKKDFTLKEAEGLTNYGIVGSKSSTNDALNKIEKYF